MSDEIPEGKASPTEQPCANHPKRLTMVARAAGLTDVPAEYLPGFGNFFTSATRGEVRRLLSNLLDR